VELPLGATEDRICGTIDIEKALGEGIKAYEPGLLVRAATAADGAVHVGTVAQPQRGACTDEHYTAISCEAELYELQRKVRHAHRSPARNRA